MDNRSIVWDCKLTKEESDAIDKIRFSEKYHGIRRESFVRLAVLSLLRAEQEELSKKSRF